VTRRRGSSPEASTGPLARIEAALGHRFARRELLQQALRHSSAAHEGGVPSNERLEFLGDAALSHACAVLLFRLWPGADEGQLTRGRAVLVRERTLVELAERLGLPAALEVGGGLRPGEHGGAVVADAVEAVLGAVLLDAGWRAFQATVRRLFRPFLEGLDPTRLPLEEPKSTLQELAQQQGKPLPLYRQVEVRGPAHRQVFVYEVELEGRVLGHGEGSSKRAAQQAAARAALEHLSR
jgi:ribonuclease-3